MVNDSALKYTKDATDRLANVTVAGESYALQRPYRQFVEVRDVCTQAGGTDNTEHSNHSPENAVRQPATSVDIARYYHERMRSSVDDAAIRRHQSTSDYSEQKPDTSYVTGGVVRRVKSQSDVNNNIYPSNVISPYSVSASNTAARNGRTSSSGSDVSDGSMTSLHSVSVRAAVQRKNLDRRENYPSVLIGMMEASWLSIRRKSSS